MASILIMGAGAVGSYYGGLLARDGHDVALVTRGAHFEALRQTGVITIREPDGTVWTAPVSASDHPQPGEFDLAIVTTKSHHTIEAAHVLRPILGPQTVVCTLQNGVENIARLTAALPDNPILGGLVFVGLTIDQPGTVTHLAEGRATIGDPTGAMPEALSRAVDIIGQSWELSVSSDIAHAQWTKLLWNVGFNTICAITGASAGDVLMTHESAALVMRSMREAVALAHAHGITIPDSAIEEMAAFRPALQHFLPSTAQDIAASKEPERDTISGFIVREGRRLGIPTPINDVLDGLLALQSDRATGRSARAPLMTGAAGGAD